MNQVPQTSREQNQVLSGLAKNSSQKPATPKLVNPSESIGAKIPKDFPLRGR